MKPLARVEFTDGTTRPVYELQGSQYVEGDDGEPIFGVWFIPEDERCDVPEIVPATAEGGNNPGGAIEPLAGRRGGRGDHMREAEGAGCRRPWIACASR